MASVDEKRNSQRTGRTEELEDVIRTIVLGDISEFAVVAEGEERTTRFVWLLVCCCTITGLLFGENSQASDA